jgi:23S rRNA (guanosine2251-2'-O)-methyltransferase
MKESKGSDDGLMIYGIRPVMEAIEAGKEIERIFIHRQAKGEAMQELKRILKDRNLSWQEVPIDKLNRLTRKNHQDVVCFISSITYSSIEEIIQSVFDSGKTPLILLLDRITDVRNFGAIARTAECSGVDAIVIPTHGAAQVTGDAIKTSAGALNIIPVCRVKNLRQTVSYLKDSGLKIFAASEKGNKLTFETDYTSPSAIIMGSEETGVANDLLALADEKIKIPLMGSIASLNVSVACGMILHEVTRQRMRKHR